MPLVHRLSGIGFASSEARVPTQPQTRLPQFAPHPTAANECLLCTTRSVIFDLSNRCCMDRYESMVGSVSEHRKLFARARRSALVGDPMPARRMIEQYRRAFGPLAAVELKRSLEQSIADERARQHAADFGDHDKQHASAA